MTGLLLTVGGFLGLTVGGLAVLGDPVSVRQADGTYRTDTGKPWWGFALGLGGAAAIALGVVLIVLADRRLERRRHPPPLEWWQYPPR